MHFIHPTVGQGQAIIVIEAIYFVAFDLRYYVYCVLEIILELFFSVEREDNSQKSLSTASLDKAAFKVDQLFASSCASCFIFEIQTSMFYTLNGLPLSSTRQCSAETEKSLSNNLLTWCSVTTLSEKIVRKLYSDDQGQVFTRGWKIGVVPFISISA